MLENLGILLAPISIFAFIGLIIYATQLVSVLDRPTTEFREPGDKLLWTIVVAFVPFLGALLFIVWKASRAAESNLEKELRGGLEEVLEQGRSK